MTTLRILLRVFSVSLAAPTESTRSSCRHGMLLTSVGLVIGLGGSLLLTPVLQSFLIDLPASDSVTFGAVAVALVAIALVASYVPARRATGIDPIVTLRTE